MSASSPGNGQYGGVLAGVKAKPSMWPTASLDTGCGHHPPAAARGSSKQLHHKIPTTEVPTESGEADARRECSSRIAHKNMSPSPQLSYNEHATPFSWTKTADELLGKIKRKSINNTRH
jgi:hypothetical protein